MPLTNKSAARKDRNSPLSVTLEHRHFAFIAAVFDSIVRMPDSPEERVLNIMANMFADAYGRSNPRFDRARFLAACGVQS